MNADCTPGKTLLIVMFGRRRTYKQEHRTSDQHVMYLSLFYSIGQSGRVGETATAYYNTHVLNDLKYCL